MKASELSEKGNKLQHKIRSVSDLIRHIKTRESYSETTNYNLFFGAGCSVTSGIRPAGKLIEEWVCNLYERFNPKPISCPAEAMAYFEENHSNWYNRDNAYSSLFEKTYEFASQRRRFVESEVDQALPSIGYAYLTSLVENKYFNTIFTTNFDDLINEAFYQFSNERPLVCAHDSSIKTISITSKRPKVVKLHGDYLFDDIKSTLRETESLEQNCKEKLIEFCKEFGLIVVGYSGNDRSIMDVLEFLTKQDNYLKNGVYWCLRKDDDVNHRLQNLFWKDKVYPVIIDGYDELFAELHAKIIGSGIDFERNIKNSKVQKIKNRILDENNIVSKNSYIKKDIMAIKDANNRQEVSDLISELNSNGESDGLSLSELRNLLEVEGLMKKGRLNQAYDLAEEYYNQSSDLRDKSRFTSKLISISDELGDVLKCEKWSNHLTSLDPHNITYMIRKSGYIPDLKDRYLYLKSKLSTYDHSSKLINSIVRRGIDLIKTESNTIDLQEEELLKMLCDSLKLTPSLTNPAWTRKYDVLRMIQSRHKEQDKNSDKDYIKDEISKHIKSAIDINKNHLVSIELELRSSDEREDFDKSKTIIAALYKLHDITDHSGQQSVNEKINQAISRFWTYDKKVDSREISRNFFEAHIKDDGIKTNAELLLSKGIYFISQEKDCNKAESYFLSALECPDIFNCFQQTITTNYCLENRHTEKLNDILHENKSRIVDRYYYEFKHELAHMNGDIESALDHLEKAHLLGLPATTYYSNYSYLMILSTEYKQLIEFERKHRVNAGKFSSDSFTINFQYALRKSNSRNFDPVVLRNIIARSKEQSLHLAAFCVLEQEKDIKRVLTEQIEISYLNYFIYKRWPIIPTEIIDSAAQDQAA